MNREIRIAVLLAAVFLVHCSAGDSTGERDQSLRGGERLAEQVRESFSAGGYVDVLSELTPLLRRLDRKSIGNVQAVYDEYMAALSESEIQPFIDAWTRFDGPGALEYALSIPFPHQASVARRAAIRSWASRDPQAANSAVSELMAKRPRLVTDLPTELVAGWVRAPQGGVEAFLLAVPERSELIGVAVGAVYRRDGPEGAILWAEEFLDRQGDSNHRWLTFRQTVRHVALRNPRLAVPFVMKHYGNEYASDGPRILAEAWIRRDPPQAFEWLKTDAPPDSQSEAVSMAVATWLNRDRAEAMRWIGSRSAEPFYYPAFHSGARLSVAKNDLEKGLELCERILDAEPRKACLGEVAEAWYRKDPVAAGLWLEASELDTEMRAAIRRRGERRRAGRSKGPRAGSGSLNPEP